MLSHIKSLHGLVVLREFSHHILGQHLSEGLCNESKRLADLDQQTCLAYRGLLYNEDAADIDCDNAMDLWFDISS